MHHPLSTLLLWSQTTTPKPFSPEVVAAAVPRQPHPNLNSDIGTLNSRTTLCDPASLAHPVLGWRSPCTWPCSAADPWRSRRPRTWRSQRLSCWAGGGLMGLLRPCIAGQIVIRAPQGLFLGWHRFDGAFFMSLCYMSHSIVRVP